MCLTLVEVKEDSDSICPEKNRWDRIKQGHKIVIYINRLKSSRYCIKWLYCQNSKCIWFLVAQTNLASKIHQRLGNMEFWHPFKGLMDAIKTEDKGPKTLYEVSSLAGGILQTISKKTEKKGRKESTIFIQNNRNRLFINVKSTTYYSMGKQIYP